MWRRGSISTLLRTDLERGISEEPENLEPLLQNGRVELQTARPETERPPRPPNLNLASGMTRKLPSHPQLQKMQMETPSNMSTPDSTPVPETAEGFPKKWRRSDRRLRRLNTELLEAIETHDVEEVERLLKAGANANATCRLDLVSACHMAAIAGGDSLSLLLKFGAEKHRLDRLGRTPLHLAAFAGNARQVAVLLDFPEEMLARVESESMSSDAEEDVRRMCPLTQQMVNVRCDLGEVRMVLPKTWKDNIDHNCKNIQGSLPVIKPGWTPLHVAASCARRHCTRLLLAAGADPNVCDVTGRTALDVTGSAYYYDQDIDSTNFTEVIKMLLSAGGVNNTMKLHGINDVDTPLHTAVELDNMDAIKELLNAGMSIAGWNAAGQTPLHVCVMKELEDALAILANYAHRDADPMSATVDVKDKEGHTVLQAAVEAAWIPGICIALETGADVTLKANDGETPIHSAAASGNIDVLTEILSVAKQKDFINCQNEKGETPLFKAILNNHLECVTALIHEGASIKITLPGNINVFHVASENGHTEILRFLLELDETVTKEMINTLSDGDKRGFGPIHFATVNNKADCVELLLSKNADIRLRTTCSPHRASTPLHVAAVVNYSDIARIILKFDKTTIHEVNSLGWFPLHSAAYNGSRDVISLLLREGGDLSCYTDGPKKFRRSAIEMIVNNMSKPTQFLEDVFDTYISANCQNFQESNCEIIVDYRILMPTVCEMEQMKVIEALLKTGNRYGQHRLLVHPLAESFLYLKWKALLPFFYTIIAFYALFVSSLTIFIVSVFYHKDSNERAPIWWDPNIWGYIIYATIFLILLQELLYMNIKSRRYFLQLETWVKFSSIALAGILPLSVTLLPPTVEWPRHVATLALLLSWLHLMFLLSRFPNWGYYVLMFGKVATNVIKILLTFAFLVIGFSLSFMVQFHSQIPFETPWAAFVKTMVMMTSEFDYMALFDKEHSTELATSLIIVRLIFLIFLILAAVVLMNLLVGVAVNDINDLEILGNIERLVKQVEFLSTLDNLVYNKVFSKILPQRINNSIKNKRKVLGTITLCPGKPRWKHFKILPSTIRDAILNKAAAQKKQKEEEIGMEVFEKKIDAIYDAVVTNNSKSMENNDTVTVIDGEDKPNKQKARFDDIMKRFTELDECFVEVKDNMKEQDCRSQVEALNVKMDQMSLDIESIKEFLSRLESKLGK